MKLGLVGAIVGGIAGALVWALIARFLHMELGYVAWGVGFAVGFMSALLGGRGTTNGVLCAIVCLLSIFGGKVLAVHWSLNPDDIRQELKASPELANASPEQLDAAIVYLRQNWTWSESIQAAKDDLGLMDIVFAVFGVITAFQLGRQPASASGSAPVYEPGSYNPIPEQVKPEDQDPPKPS